MSSEGKKCVCGHEESEHEDYGCEAVVADGLACCPCWDFRPSLDWPDSEGWWRMKDPMRPGDELVYASGFGDPCGVSLLRIGQIYRFQPHDLRGVSFVKLLEESPFPTQEKP